MIPFYIVSSSFLYCNLYDFKFPILSQIKIIKLKHILLTSIENDPNQF